MSDSMNRTKKIAALEAKVLRATMRRFYEHRKQYPDWDELGHPPAAVAMVKACRELAAARRK